MGDNKILKDGNGNQFITKTTETEGVNTPHVHVDSFAGFYTQDVEDDASNNTTFVGKQRKDGTWLVQEIAETSVGAKTSTAIRYASILNNATKTTYGSAWTDRATLTYSEIKNLL